jgi:hypothetical protein
MLSRSVIGLSAAFCACAVASPARAAAPAPCGGTAQITDATGDGHHAGTDVLSAWFAEGPNGLQAVIRPSNGTWGSEHDDAETATWSMLFTVAGQTRFVRLSARTAAPGVYDTGTWTAAGGFVPTGTTTGVTEPGSGGSVRIDVPATVSGGAGTVLAQPFVLTSDGFDGPGAPHWVDRAPGGISPAESAFGADFVVGTCAGGDIGAGPGGGTGGPGATGGGLSSVFLSVTPRRRGSGTETVSGRIAPARGGVPVVITATRAVGGRATRHTATTAGDGRFSISVPIAETTRLRAVAEGLGSQTRTVTVVAKVRIKVRRLRSGAAVITGTVSPAVPGRVLWLRTTAITPSARATVQDGRFTFRLKRPAKGRYQALFSPTGDRVERATSNTGTIR